KAAARFTRVSHSAALTLSRTEAPAAPRTSVSDIPFLPEFRPEDGRSCSRIRIRYLGRPRHRRGAGASAGGVEAHLPEVRLEAGSLAEGFGELGNTAGPAARVHQPVEDRALRRGRGLEIVGSIHVDPGAIGIA